MNKSQGLWSVEELRAVHDMLVAAAEVGMSCEVVLEFSRHMVLTGGLVLRSCSESLKIID